jgi:hypothetical protein
MSTSPAMNRGSLCKQTATIYGTSKLTGYILLKPVNRFAVTLYRLCCNIKYTLQVHFVEMFVTALGLFELLSSK